VRPTRFRRISGVLPPPGPQRAMVLSSFVNRVGTGLFNTASVLYFTLVVHLPPTQVGAGLTVAGVVGLLGGIPAGDLADRHGPRTVQLVTLGIQTATMAAFVFVHSFWAFTVVATLDRFAESATNASRGAVIARVGGERPAVFRAKLRAFVNLGIVVGTFGAAFAIQVGTRSAYTSLILLNVVSYVLCALLLLRVPNYAALPRPKQERRFAALADRPYLAFAALDGAMSLQFQATAVLLPIWIVFHTRAPHWAVSAVFIVNSGVIVFLLTRIGARVETVAQGGRALRSAGFLFLVSCPLLATVADLPMWAALVLLVVAVGIHSVGAVWQQSAGFALGFGLAPDHAQGQYQGLHGLGLDTGQALAPLILTTACLSLGQAGWVLLGVFLAGLGMLAPPLTRWAERSRRDSAAAMANA
jgi:hypothetical protein